MTRSERCAQVSHSSELLRSPDNKPILRLWQFLEQFESELRVWNLKAELNQFRQLCASRTLHRNLVIIRDKADPIPLLVGGAQIG